MIEYFFGETGVWYLIGLGAAAVVFALFLPRGLWGSVEEKFGIRLLPIGYRLRLLHAKLSLNEASAASPSKAGSASPVGGGKQQTKDDADATME